MDGRDVTDFIVKWEDLTLDWSDEQRINKILLYGDKLNWKVLKDLDILYKLRLVQIQGQPPRGVTSEKELAALLLFQLILYNRACVQD